MTLQIPIAIVRECEYFFRPLAAARREGTALLAGRTMDGVDRIEQLVIPHQETGSGFGSWVEVTEEGKHDLVSRLPLDQRYLSRIHSHPGDAFHSSMDDRNPILTAEGSWSIVVPNFGIDLSASRHDWAVYRFRSGRWVDVSLDEGLDEVQLLHD